MYRYSHVAGAPFRLLVVQRSTRACFRHLVPLWARLPGWTVRTVEGAAQSSLPARGDRPHAVLADVDPACAGRVLRMYPEARQVLHLDEHFDPAGAAGFDTVTCAWWWQRERMPDALRQRARVLHPGVPQLRSAPGCGLTLPDGRWLGGDSRALIIATEGWPANGPDGLLPDLIAALLDRTQAPLLLVVPRDALPVWRALIVDQRVCCVEDPGAHNRHLLLRVSALLVCGRHQPDWLLEAMATGCPVLAQDGPAMRELVRHEINGRLAPPADAPGPLARMTAELLADVQTLARFAREAQADVGRDFDTHAAAARYARLLGALADDDVLPARPLPDRLIPAGRGTWARFKTASNPKTSLDRRP